MTQTRSLREQTRANFVKTAKPEKVCQKDRPLNINPKGNELKAEARANLTSEYGMKMRSLRPIEVESALEISKAILVCDDLS
ncbi:hypothetical protein DEAC_c37170 [Desulfosporosinus acididurans]|uniref:Uncharacterized protein n=1 Tax=Desulfosporosinus acididurans TaxID=476652 RepID=A0A0J1FLP1_9FIRM|nr:hypothetical protein [Desulfosporosinus acididurans]KLU64287.1 hypothetical protein DEAC_c37170 [Desulfosporosinus acididurans]